MINYFKQLHVKGFKSLKDIIIPFNQLTVLAGANSVGKSTVIQSLLLTRTLFDNKSNKRLTVNCF